MDLTLINLLTRFLFGAAYTAGGMAVIFSTVWFIARLSGVTSKPRSAPLVMLAFLLLPLAAFLPRITSLHRFAFIRFGSDGGPSASPTFNLRVAKREGEAPAEPLSPALVFHRGDSPTLGGRHPARFRVAMH